MDRWPPQLRMFMRTTLHPAAQALAELPMTYCESEEPSSPWTSTTVSTLAAHACGLPVAVAEDLAADLSGRPRRGALRLEAADAGAGGSCRRWSVQCGCWRGSGGDGRGRAMLATGIGARSRQSVLEAKFAGIPVLMRFSGQAAGVQDKTMAAWAARYVSDGPGTGILRIFGAASGVRTHDIRCHRPAFCH